MVGVSESEMWTAGMMQDDYFPCLHHHNRLLVIATGDFFTLKFCFDVEQLRYCISVLKIL